MHPKGRSGSGLGSAHQSHGLRPLHPGPQCYHQCVWPLGFIMEGLTLPLDSPRQQELQALLLSTDAGTGYMHEGFSVMNASEYNRDLFGWANSLFAFWVITVPHLTHCLFYCARLPRSPAARATLSCASSLRPTRPISAKSSVRDHPADSAALFCSVRTRCTVGLTCARSASRLRCARARARRARRYGTAGHGKG